MGEFTMPSLGPDMEEGTLLEWLVGPGDTVHRGDLVAVVDTAKAAVEVETFEDGVVDRLLVEPGTTVTVGTPLAVLAAPGAAPSPAPVTTAAAPRTTPLVRRLAAELGVDLASVVGTAPAGRITQEDVRHAAAAPAEAAPATLAPATRRRVTPYARRLAAELGVDLEALPARDGEPVRVADVRAAAGPTEAPAPVAAPPAPAPVDPMRATIAAVMSRSKREIPHYYLSTTVDLADALDWMHRRNLDLPLAERLVPAALLLKAAALAAREVPEVNGFWADGRFVPGEGVHLGVAVSLRGGGLVAPALHEADRMPLPDVMHGLRDLVTRARGGRLRGRELTEATLTVTNLGDQGVESVHGVIHPPQVALVGFGRVVRRPWAVGDLLGIRPVVTLTLAADHRATDGFTGGRFLTAVDRILQQPEEL
ncbi:2-oxo acid dehydrogenase subunit E2 [Nocardioides guangzhouensis]|uniref:Dihydrolipoamide acetyltransferase component of pyruvate dehydrogenase complex n=1 Tax=Nocardioides guangzhouensis TaxID=2497878 RepID=A0A4Q4Z4W4_9ACTN|nr:dihydrolipoamide acetyltransferase family protein [Nocardioides guangzhouensis]RYP82682.1 2-oxo acid dehydrogenase subunit E2 [Nocardioides guangzhouensis]